MILLIAGFDWFAKGGWAMYPLALLSVYTLFVILNRAVFFATHLRRTDSELDSVLRGTSLLPDRMEGVLAPMLARGIKHGEFDPGRANLAIEHEMLEATRYLNSLDTVAMISPMIGLLGTVSGMVATFQTVADLQGAVNPSVLAGGIWEALLTTAFGLIVAIPAIVGFRYFRSRLIRWENHLRTVVDDASLIAGDVKAGVHPVKATAEVQQ